MNGGAQNGLGKWIERGHADTPTVVVARKSLKQRLKAVRRMLAAVSASDYSAESVHQLRVATRRSSAALDLFRSWISPSKRRSLRERLKRIRRAAAAARRVDVHESLFRERLEQADETSSVAYLKVLGLLRRARETADVELVKVAAEESRAVARESRSILRRLEHPRPLAARKDDRREGYTLRQLAGRELPAMVDGIASVGVDQLADVEAVHALRLQVKKLRYVLELLAPALPAQKWSEVRPQVEELQEVLGKVNDAHEVFERLLEDAAESGHSESLVELHREERDHEHRGFVEWWAGESRESLVAGLHSLASHCSSPVEPTPASTRSQHHRVAAIDVGTNSVRLVVAETDPNRVFRVIEDLKETTRLGQGMFDGNRLSQEAIRRTVDALAKFKRIADGHRVEVVRGIGTAAVREAENRDEFLEAAAEVGVPIEVVDGEREGRLAFASVAGAINLGRRRVAVIDIGGGSAEVVLSSGGLIDSIHSMKLGAVRMTEAFAHLPAGSDERYFALRAAVSEAIAVEIPPPKNRIDAVVGTGGTFNNLARLAVRNGAATVGGDRFMFAVAGCELPYAEVVRILDWLRKMSPEELRSIGGISAQRAEIIVAGVTVVERLMAHLGVERLQVHDGGVRDGLLAETIDELGLNATAPARRPSDALAAARDFAARFVVDRPHAEQVTRLALHLFDQLARLTPDATGSWASHDARLLLEIGALLHDCGYVVDERSHNRHGADMLRHAELPLLAARELEIVAQLARYHRRKPPSRDHAEFRRLSEGDQRLVAHLAGILRIADGLDYPHDQCVRTVRVQKEAGAVVLHVVAPDEPAVGILHARKKSDAFVAAFHTDVAFAWEPDAAPQPPKLELAGAAS